MKQQPRRCHSPNTKARKTRKQATPEQIRSYIEECYQLRQAEWHIQLLEDERPNWSEMLGLHLQLAELERLQAGVEELF
jgi:hypothetical protein